MTIGLDIFTLLMLMVVLMILGGHLCRIADAIERQNAFYKIPQSEVVERRCRDAA